MLEINVFDSIAVVDRLDYGLLFDGTSTGINATSAPTGLTNTGSWTYEIILKVNSFTNGAGTDGSGTYFLDRVGSTNGLISLKAVGSKFSWQIRNDAAGGLTGFGNTTIDTAIHHIAMVRNSGDKFYLFVDGVLSASLSDTYGALTPPTPILGKQSAAQGYTPGVFYGFKISTGAKWIANFTPPSVLIKDSTTALIWTLDQMLGTSATDTSGNSNHGTIVGTGVWNRVNINETPLGISLVDNVSVAEDIIYNRYLINVSPTYILSESLTSPPTGVLSGTATYDSTNGYAILIAGQSNTTGTLQYTDAQLNTKNFNAMFDWYRSGSADGVFFYWGCSTTNGNGYRIYFDFFNNRILVQFNGVTLQTITPLTAPNGSFASVSVRVTYSGGRAVINIGYNGRHMLTDFVDVIRANPGSLYGWQASNGGQTSTQRIKNLLIEDVTNSDTAFVDDVLEIVKLSAREIFKPEVMYISEDINIFTNPAKLSVVDNITVAETTQIGRSVFVSRMMTMGIG